MKRADIEKIKQLDFGKLDTQAQSVKKEIATMIMNMKTHNLKNTNAIADKKKELAVILTIMRQKRT